MAEPERRTAALLAIATLLLPLQTWPPMPLPGMQLADVVFALAFAQFLIAGRDMPPPRAALPIAAFGAGVTVSAALGGVNVKLLGHFELMAIGWMAACASPAGALSLRRALVLAAAIAATFAATGAALYYAGIATPLLNVYGQLEPGDYPRVRGTMITASMMASVVAGGFLMLWAERDLMPQPWPRRLVLAVAGVALLFAFSRTVPSFLVVLAGAALWRRRAARWLWAAWAGAALATAAALWISVRYQVVLNPLAPWALEVRAADGSRFAIWREAAGIIAANPLAGIGPGKLLPGGWSAHNTWINLWALLGVVPLLAFAGLFAAALPAALRAGSLGLAAALIVALADSLHTDIEDMRHVWLMLGLALGGGAARPHGQT